MGELCRRRVSAAAAEQGLFTAFVKFYDGLTDIVQAMGKCTAALSMVQFLNLYTIYGIDVSAQQVVSQSSTCLISVELKEMPTKNDDN